MVYTQPRIRPGKWDAQNSAGFLDKNESSNFRQMARPRDNNKKRKKKRTCRIVDFEVSADHRVKLKESEKRDKYLDFAK